MRILLSPLSSWKTRSIVISGTCTYRKMYHTAQLASLGARQDVHPRFPPQLSSASDPRPSRNSTPDLVDIVNSASILASTADSNVKGELTSSVLAIIQHINKVDANHPPDPSTLRQLLSLTRSCSHVIGRPQTSQLLTAVICQIARLNYLHLLPAAIAILLHSEPNRVALLSVLKSLTRLDFGSHIVCRQIGLVLDACGTRSIPIPGPIHDNLLTELSNQTFLARTVHQSMLRSEHTPSPYQLSALMQAFSKRGDSKEARRYLQAIRKTRKGERDAGEEVEVPLHPRAWTLKYRRGGPSRLTKDNSIMLQSFKRHDHVLQYFDYLRGVATAPRAQRIARLQNPASKQGRMMSSIDWTVLISKLGKDRSIPNGMLISLLDKLEDSGLPHATIDVGVYNMVLARLVDRQALDLALDVWKRLKSRCNDISRSYEEQSKWSPNKYTYTIGISMFCKRKEFKDAFRLLEEARDTLSASQHQDLPPSIVKSRTLDVALVNSLLTALARAGHSDVVYEIWTRMLSRYGVLPDERTVRDILNIGTYQSVGHEPDLEAGNLSLGEALAERLAVKTSDLIARRRRMKRAKAAGLEGDLTNFHDYIEKMLQAGPVPKEDAVWEGMVAWQRARLIFLEIVLGNWPGLSLIRSPVESGERVTALFFGSRGGRASHTTPTVWLQPSQEELMSPPHPTPANTNPQGNPIDEQSSLQDPRIIPSPPSYSLYPQIVPTDFMFRSYISLLGEHSLTDQIPLALAWMRALDIVPNKATLSEALGYFKYRDASISLVPLVQRLYGERTGSYGRLVDWVEGWVGKECVPSDSDVALAWHMAQEKVRVGQSWVTKRVRKDWKRRS